MRARRLPAVLTLIAVVGLLGLLSATARAQGTPDISASASSSSTLYGEPVHVTLDAANPSAQPYGYNLSFRVVLPNGVSYAGGSPVAPTAIANAPSSGETTLIFSNVADLSPNSHEELGFKLEYDQAVLHAGDVFPVRAQAFVNSDPRYVPKFTATGEPEGPSATSFTGFSGEVVGEQRLKAIEVTASEPSPEGEILRGAHEDQTVYALQVRNNGVNPTTGTKLDAYVPAGLEFFGCGAAGGAGTDNTTQAIGTNPGSAEEYPGSGPIEVETLAECSTPESVETELVDPDGAGPLPEAVYTHVVWDAGTLTPGQVKTFKYRVAVPILANTNEFSGGTRPSAASGEQAANLDNNTGPEVVDETLLRTYATASGTYQGTTPTPTSDEAILDRTAEDWVVHKSTEATRLEQGQDTKWTLTFETSEYKYVKDGIVTDTLPNGLCPLGAANFTHAPHDAADPECDPVAGKEPTAPYSSAVENADGSWTLSWNATQFAAVQHTAINDKFTLSFWTHTRTHYQSNFEPTTPILSHDKIANGVTTEADGFARCLAPEATNCENPAAKISHEVADGAKIGDASSATLEAEGPKIRKLVSQAGANCQTATYVLSVPAYHPGDRVCWNLRVEFPGTLDTDAQTIADYLPPGTAYVTGSDEPFGENNVEATLDESNAAGGLLSWAASSKTVPAGGEVFERVLATEVKPLGTVVNGDLKGNLMKFSSANTPGESEALRAEANYEISTPVMGLTKGVEKVVRGVSTVNGPNGANVDHVQVEDGDEVTYRVDVENSGGQDAVNVEVWDILPADYSCSEVTGISDGGECLTTGPGDHIVWVVPKVAIEEAKKLTYTAKVPATVGPGRTLANTAGVRQFQGETNTGGTFTYTPAENIDPSNSTEPNAPAAKDPSDVLTTGATVGKTRTTSVNEAGNSVATQATIGETITYTVTANIPEGTTLGGSAELTDALSSVERQPYVAGSATAMLNGGALPAGFELDTSGSTPRVIFPAGYSNAAGSGTDQVVLTFEVVVANVAGNARGSGLTNQATLSWSDPGVGAQSAKSPTVSTTVVEPLISQAKTDNKNPARVNPGEVVTYTVTTSNSNAANVSTAHEVAIVDEIPVGLTPVKGAGEPLADNEEVPGSGGAVWHSGSRTITKSVATIAPNANSSFTYLAEVDNPAVAGAEFTNAVKGTTASLDSSASDRRTSGAGYEAAAEDTVRIGGASVTKLVTPESGTIGQALGYEVTVTIPPSVALFDTTVKDVLPDSIEFDGYGSVECVSGCPPQNAANFYTPVVNGDGTTRIAWSLGDISPLAEAQVIKLLYSAHVRGTHRNGGALVLAGQAGINVVTVSSDRTDKGSFEAGTIPTSFDETLSPAEATETFHEPDVTLDKQVKVGNGSFGDGPDIDHSEAPLTYRLLVKNTGDSPAYDLKVSDQPDPALTNVQVEAQAGVTVVNPWSEAEPQIEWEIPGPIAPNETVTLVYTADLVEVGLLHDGQELENTASIPLYFGLPESTREEHPGFEYRNYAGNSDSAEVLLDFPTFTLVKTTGLEEFPDTGKAEIGQDFPWRVVATNSSATAGATNVHVTDTLPPNWTYKAGSATLSPGGAQEPTITSHPTGDTLEWTVPSLAAGANVTITFEAKPQLAAATSPGTGAEANVNAAQVTSATDEGGNTGNEAGPYGSSPDTATATLAVPALTIEKTPDNGAATAGQPSSFTVKVENTGNATARNVDIEDVLPAGLGYSAGSASGNPPAGFSESSVASGPGAGETTIHWHLTSLAEGATETITVPVSVAANVADGTTLTNTASVTSEELPTPESDTGSLDVAAEADMSIEKTGAATYTAGDEYSWHLRVKNLGPSDAQSVVVSDPLPAGTSFVSASAPCSESSGEVKCVLGTEPAGFDQTYDVTVEVDPDTTTSPLNNTVTVSSTTTDTNPGNNSSTFGPSPSPLADVSVLKTADPEAVLKGHETTFTILVSNAGPSTARAVKLEDPLPVGLEFVSTDEPLCTEAGGTVSCELGDMVPGAEETIHVTAKGTANGIVTNTATVSTTTPEPLGGGNPDSGSAEVEVGPVADLGLIKTAPATVPADGQLTWTLEVTNHGPDDATGVEVVDPLPVGVQFVSADPGCTQAGGIVTCGIGTLAVGGSASRQITVTVPHALADSTLLNTATVRGDQGDDEPEDESADATTKVGPSADLAIAKSGPARVNADGTIAWTLVAANNGPSTATGVTVTDPLPSGVTLVSTSPSQGSCGAGAAGATCALGTLVNGGSAQIQVVGKVAASLQGTTLTNTATIAGEQPDPVARNDTSSATTAVDAPAPADFNLVLRKTLEGPGKPELGEVLRYGITVENEGPATAKTVKIVDTLPSSLKYVSASIPGGRCSTGGSVVTCKLPSLAPGAEKRATVEARAVRAGSVKNTATVTAALADEKASDNRDGAVAGIAEGRAALRVVKQRLGRGPVEAGKTVKFRIRVTNTSQSAAADVLLCDHLPSAMSYVSVAGSRFERGNACWSIDMLAAGASRSYQVKARVDGGAGGGTIRNVAVVQSDNTPTRSDAAAVQIESSGPGRGGGVTG